MSQLQSYRSARPWAVALAFSVLILLAGSRDLFWSGDFYVEAWPAYQALGQGDVGRFIDLLPGYSGFTVAIGAPSALLTAALGGAETMAFRFSAVPALVALGALGVAVAGPVRARGNRAWPLFLLAAAGGAMAYQGVAYGHPEDLLATALALGAALCARADRPVLAGALLVAAIVSKQWAVLAILPVAMAAPRGGVRIAVVAGAATAVLVGVQTQLGGGAHGAITTTGSLFHPHQVWWPFGIPATPEFMAAGHGERMGPAWLAPLVRPMILAAGACVALAWWVRSGPDRNRDDVFGVLALVFLARCLLDPWNLVYYHLPLVASLAVWEARRGRDLPVLALAANAAAWITFVSYGERTGNGPYLAYLAWALPLAAGLAIALLRPVRTAPRRALQPQPA